MARDQSYAWVGGLLLGAAAMYFLDPQVGRERQQRALDALNDTARAAEEGITRILGGAEPAPPPPPAPPEPQDPLKLFLEGRVDDPRVYERVRDALRHLSTVPDAIQVSVRDGVVTLEGQVLETEVADVVLGVRRVPGLVRLESRMEAVKAIDAVDRTAVNLDMNRDAVTAARVGAGMAAMALMRPRNALVAALLIGGGYALARSGVLQPRRMRRSRRVTAQHTVEVEAPVEQVFAFWSSFRNFPRFMEHLLEVRELDAGVSHWIAEDPDGNPVTCNVEITALKPHKRIAWRSLEGGMLYLNGEVEFEALAENRTRVTLTLTRDVQERIGESGALLGSQPEEQVRLDLERFRTVLSPSLQTAG